MQVEKLGEPREIWVMCPKCEGMFYVERTFAEPKFREIPLYCPHCKQNFLLREAARSWGL